MKKHLIDYLSSTSYFSKSQFQELTLLTLPYWHMRLKTLSQFHLGGSSPYTISTHDWDGNL